MTTTTKTRTITLTDHRPVRIEDDQWPVIAEGSAYHECGQTGQNGAADVTLRVRQRADGKALIYVTVREACRCDPAYPGARTGGRIHEPWTDSDELPTVIRSVATELCAKWANEIADEAIASLPAEQL